MRSYKFYILLFLTLSVSSIYSQKTQQNYLCEYNSILFKIEKDSTINYNLSLFNGWRNKFLVKKARAKILKVYFDETINDLRWIVYENKSKNESTIISLGYKKDEIVKIIVEHNTPKKKYYCDNFWRK